VRSATTHYHRVSCDLQLPDDVITIGVGIRKDYGRSAGKRAQCDIEPEQRPSSAAADHPETVCATLLAAYAPFVDTRLAAPEIAAARRLLAELGQ